MEPVQLSTLSSWASGHGRGCQPSPSSWFWMVACGSSETSEGVDGGWFGGIAAFEIEVSCPVQPAWEFTDGLEDEVLATATFIRDNSPQFFNLESLPDNEKRAIAYDMMTTAINDLRNKGIETGRCVANPGIPVSDPFHWCSDVLVVGPPGEAVTIDIYQSWSAPATPQVLITETNQTGVVTDDLVSMP